jgi:serine/threonine protein kinase
MADQLLGKTVATFQVSQLLGKGGMGSVYKARDLQLERNVALKVMDSHLASDEAFMKRFRIEAKALAQLHDSHIVSIHALQETELGTCIIMEYVEGITLAELIKASGNLELGRIFHLFRQILSAVEHAHKAGVTHRDIKPSNVLITNDDEVKIVDFGLAKILSPSGATVTQLTGGTLYYASPEQLEGLSTVDHRSDIYSIGMTLYEALTGQVPFTKTESDFRIREKIINGKIPPPREINPGVNKALSSLVMKAIAREQDRRFQTAAEMRAALEQIERDGQKRELRETESKPKFKISRNVLIGVSSAIVLLLLVLAAKDWLFAPATYVNVTTIPPEASVKINNGQEERTPIYRFKVREGETLVEVRKENFERVDTIVSIGSGETATLILTLRKVVSAPGELRTQTEVVPPHNEENLSRSIPTQSKETPPSVKVDDRKTDETRRRREQQFADVRVKGKEKAPTEKGHEVPPHTSDVGKKNEPAIIPDIKKHEEVRTEASNADAVKIGLNRLRDEYVRCLEREDLSSLKSLLQLTDTEEEIFGDFFEKAKDITVSVEQYKAIPTTPTSAEIAFRANVSYFNTTTDESLNQMMPNRWQCEYQGGRWVIVGRKLK